MRLVVTLFLINMCSKEELIKPGVVPEVLELFHVPSSDIANISSFLLNKKKLLVLFCKNYCSNSS